MSKNNTQEYVRKMEQQRQRFGLRKLSIGVASVLLGTTFIVGGSTIAHADSTINDSASVQEASIKDQSMDKSVTASFQDNNQTNNKSTIYKNPTAKALQNHQLASSSTSNNIEENVTNFDKQDVHNSTLQESKTSSSLTNNNLTQDLLINKNDSFVKNNSDDQVAPTNVFVAKDPENTGDNTSIQTSNQDEAQLTINFNDVDDSNDHLDPIIVSGKIGDDVSKQVTQALRDKEKLNYEYWAKEWWNTNNLFHQSADSYYLRHKVFLNEPSQSLTIDLEHKKVHISSYYPETPDDIIDGTDIHYPAGVAKDDLNKTYTRTIRWHYKDGTTKDEVIQSIAISRNADYDLKTNTVKYGKWSGADKLWESYKLPSDAYLTQQEWEAMHFGGNSKYLPAGTIDSARFNYQDQLFDVYLGHITYHVEYVNALTGEPLQVYESNPGKNLTDENGAQDVNFGLNVADETLGEYQKQSLYSPFIAAIPGYKFVGDWDSLKNQKIGNEDKTLVLQYAPLSPVEVQYVDQKDGKVLLDITLPTTYALPKSVGDAEKAGPQNYETHPLDDIPGYEYTYEHSNNVDGFVGQVQTKDSKNPIVVKYYYKVIPGQEKVAEYTRKSLRDDHPNKIMGLYMHGSVDDPIDYSNVPAGIANHINTTGNAFVGAINSKDGYFSDSRTVLEYVFTSRQKVTVNYIDETTGKQFDNSTVTLTPNVQEQMWNWDSTQKSFDGYAFIYVDRPISGKYGFLEQEVNYYYAPIATRKTETKTATRTIHYVANDRNGNQLMSDTLQNVTLIGTYFVDKDGNRTGVKEATVNGEKVYVVDKNAPINETWTVNADKSRGLTSDKLNFSAITTPALITLSSDEAKKRNVDSGDWHLVNTEDSSEVSYGNPESADWKTDTPNKIADGYLVYKQKAQYNIHYIDVNGVEGKTTYEPTDGTELKDHQVTGVGSEDKTYVGDTPDATSKLWSPADYEKAGYVLVGLSDNAKGDLLGKQTLTKGVQDQYVYLKHQVVEVTPHTPDGDVPSNPKDPSKPSVDKNELSKSYTRNIYYKANTADGQTLKDQTTQKVTFEASVYVDKVTHETSGVETVTDVNSKQVQVANGQPGKITWNKTIVDGNATKLTDSSARFNSVDQPTIDLEKGNKYATSDDMTGTWYLVDGEANELDLTPNSSNPVDKTLVYKQKAQYNIHYIDVNGVEGKTTYEPTDGTELKDHQVTGVGSEDKTYVGDTPDATQQLWSPADYERAGYVLVGLSDNAKGDLLGKQTLTHGVQDQYVYLKHQVVEVTPHTPDGDIPSDSKDPSKPSVDKDDLSKSYTRNIYYKANTADGPTLKDQTTQKVTFEASVYVDKVTHETSGVETVTDANGNQVQVANGQQGKVTWNKTIVDGNATKLTDSSARFNSIDQPTIDLEKGDKYATSDDMVGTWHWISGVANKITLTPTSDNPADCVLVYEKNKSESGPSTDYDLATTRIDTETKTFTRDVIYRGTKDGGVHFEKVNGSPDSRNKYVQKTTFTRRIIKLLDKDGNVVKVLGTTPWTSENDTFGEVISKTPSAVGYELVDIEKVDAHKINPNTDPEDLGETIVTYSMKPKHETGPSTDHDLPTVDTKQEAKTFTRTIVYRGTKDGGVHYESVNGSPDGKNTYKQTVTFTRNVFSTTDKDGKVTILEIDPWTAKDDTLSEVISKTPSAVGYEVVDIEKVDAHKIDPAKDPENLGETIVTYSMKPKHESGPSTDHDLPTVDTKQEAKTFTRTIVYRGTKDGGVHYESVNGSPDGKNTYKQTVTFTRNVFSTTAKDGKVTILEIDPWTAKDDTLGEVISKTPGEVGYDEVDIKAVNARTIDPDKDNTDLGTITVTYRATPAQPTVQPSEQPTSQPTVQPSEQPTAQPTSQPTVQPTEQPTVQPTAQPSEQPTTQPTVQPSEQPTTQPTVQPSEQPTTQPTVQPSEQPTSQLTEQPTEQPTTQPTVQPSEQPTAQPTSQPTVQPTEQPTVQPTAQPSEQPTTQPTVQPSEQPTSQPTAQPAIESNTQLPSEQKNEEPQPMTTQVTAKKGETSIVEPTKSSSTQPTTKQGAQQLPQTGNQKSSSLIGLGFAGLLSALGLTKVNKKRKD